MPNCHTWKGKSRLQMQKLQSVLKSSDLLGLWQLPWEPELGEPYSQTCISCSILPTTTYVCSLYSTFHFLPHPIPRQQECFQKPGSWKKVAGGWGTWSASKSSLSTITMVALKVILMVAISTLLFLITESQPTHMASQPVRGCNSTKEMSLALPVFYFLCFLFNLKCHHCQDRSSIAE